MFPISLRMWRSFSLVITYRTYFWQIKHCTTEIFTATTKLTESPKLTQNFWIVQSSSTHQLANLTSCCTEIYSNLFNSLTSKRLINYQFCSVTHQLTFRAQKFNSLATSWRSSERENGRKYTISLIRPRNSSRRKWDLRIGCTTFSLKFRDTVIFSGTSPSSLSKQKYVSQLSFLLDNYNANDIVVKLLWFSVYLKMLQLQRLYEMVLWPWLLNK